MAKRTSNSALADRKRTAAAQQEPRTDESQTAAAAPRATDTAESAPASEERAAGKPKSAAQAVREYLIAHPEARNRDIVRALAAQGTVIDDSIPAQIKSRDKKGRKQKPAAEATETVAAATEPTIFVHAPLYDQFARDLLAVKTHSQAVKNLRILVARLERIIVMMELLKDDDWNLVLLAKENGVLFSATHAQVHNAAQARARLEKLAIQPNEVVLVG